MRLSIKWRVKKERNTLETLLVSPASRRDVVVGKFAAVVCVCLISAAMTVCGLVIPFVSHLKMYDWLAAGGLKLEPVSVLVIALSIIPMALLFAGVLLGVSTFSRNQKEAQSYLGTLLPLIGLPAMASLFTGSITDVKMAFVPILNASLMIKQALRAETSTFNLSDWPFSPRAFTLA